MENNMPEKEIKENAAEPVEAVTENLPSKESEETKKKMKINWKMVIVAVAVVLIAAGAYFFKGLLIAATINGQPIGRLTVIERMEKIYGKTMLDSLINQKLVSDEAKAQNMTVGSEEISAEITKLEDQVKTQGSTLDAVLALQNMTRADLEQQIVFQKEVEKLVADKITVTDEEVTKYIKDYQITIPKDQEGAANEQIKNEIKNQKLNQEGEALLTALKAKAKINYFVKY